MCATKKKNFLIRFKQPLERIQYSYLASAETEEEALEAVKFLFPKAIIIEIKEDQ